MRNKDTHLEAVLIFAIGICGLISLVCGIIACKTGTSSGFDIPLVVVLPALILLLADKLERLMEERSEKRWNEQLCSMIQKMMDAQESKVREAEHIEHLEKENDELKGTIENLEAECERLSTDYMDAKRKLDERKSWQAKQRKDCPTELAPMVNLDV